MHYSGIAYTYETGWKDWCAVFFYTLICVIMHAVIQEYGVDVSQQHQTVLLWQL